jgi:hypothetical protein
MRDWEPMRADVLQPARQDVRVRLQGGILPPHQRIQLPS